MQSKGQVTVYIIIGIIVLVIVGLVLFFVLRSDVERVSSEIPQVAQVPFEVAPVSAFVQDCTLQTTKDALRALGDRGGFVTHSLETNLVTPTEGDAVSFAPGADLSIPYWFHLKSDNECTGSCEFSSSRPALFATSSGLSIEGQLESFIEDNVDTCLRGFAPLPDFSVTPRGEADADVRIARDAVHVVLDYPLDVLGPQGTHTINEFATSADVNLLEIYEVATTLTNRQAEARYLEEYTRNLIEAFSRVDKNALPPVTGFVIDFGPGEHWLASDVERDLKNILTAHIPLLQVFGARNHQFIEAPSSVEDPEMYQIIHNRGALIPLEDVPNTVNVKFSYLDWWKPYFDINCNGELCQSDSFTSTFGFAFGMQRYQFAYDLSYPVLVEIENPDALGGEGYSFKFLLESNLRNNRPLPADFAPLQVIDIPQGSQFCEFDMRTSGEMRVLVRDGKTHDLMTEEVFFSYACGQESCAFNPVPNGSTTLHLPVCLGGALQAHAKNYYSNALPLDAVLDQSQDLELLLQPLRALTFDVEHVPLRKGFGGWALDERATMSLEDDEEVVIQLERLGDPFEDAFSSFALIRGASRGESLNTDIPLIPGNYSVIVAAFKYAEPPLLVPEKTMTVDGGPFASDETIILPGAEFNATNPFPSVSSNFVWELKQSDIDAHNTVTFRTIKIALEQVPESARDMSDLAVIGDLDGYYEAYPSLLKPRWSNE